MKLYKPKQEFVNHSFLFMLYFPFTLNSRGGNQHYTYVVHDKMINEQLKTWLSDVHKK